MAGRGSSGLARPRRSRPGTPRRRATRTMSCWLRACGTPPRRTAAKKPRREAIALRPDEPLAYYNLGAALATSGHYVEAAQRYLEASERFPVGSERWAMATASAFDTLRKEECDEVAKPEWWNDEGLKALSARVVRAAPKNAPAHAMRAWVLGLQCGAWEEGPRSAAELREAAAHFDRSAVLTDAPAVKAEKALMADECRCAAAAIEGS